MKIYKSQEEFEKEIKDNVFYSDESIDITAFDINVKADIEVNGNINARDINAWDITATDINAGNINAMDINVWDIKAREIKARDINAWDIKAREIKAENVKYGAVAFAYKDIKVKSIKGRRENCRHFVLDGKIEVKTDDQT